jgi:hypothetical protein
MQSTLSNVERSAATAHTHVFNDEHTQALDDLREAQILLARAWGRGSEDPRHHQRPHSSSNSSENNDSSREATTPTTATTTTAPPKREEISAGPTLHRTSQNFPRHAENNTTSDSSPPTADDSNPNTTTAVNAGDTPHPPSAAAAASVPPLSSASAQSLEDATARDIQRANERRAANEEYFRKVAAGVREVVGKLEGVAEAMRRVEERSRGLWEDGTSVSSSAETERSGQTVIGTGRGG